jgi:two-component system phosphate regulon response regulator OmpR
MLQLKILIVDDNEHLSSLLKYYLCDQGFSVDIVGDGQKMTKKMERNPFDLIILDWILSGENGLSICCRLGEDENSPPVIMVTGSGGEAADRILGLDCWFRRPLRYETVSENTVWISDGIMRHEQPFI